MPHRHVAGGGTARPRGAAAAADRATVAPRSVVVVVEERAVRAPGRRSAGVEPDVLDRLAAAAGIAAEWWDMAGDRHVVGAETKRALLAAMGLAASSTGEARARLVEIADRARAPRAAADRRRRARARRSRVALAMATRRAGGIAPRFACGTRTAPSAILRSHGRRPARERRDGGRRARVAQRMLTLPLLPVGDYTLRFDDDPAGTCRVVVAPERCFLPPALRARRAPLRPRGAPVRAAAARRPGHRRFHDAVARWPRPPRARAAASSASIRCTRSSPATASARVPTIRPIAAFSIRSTSTSSACPISRHRDEARELLARNAARASRRSRPAPPSTTPASGS